MRNFLNRLKYIAHKIHGLSKKQVVGMSLLLIVAGITFGSIYGGRIIDTPKSARLTDELIGVVEKYDKAPSNKKGVLLSDAVNIAKKRKDEVISVAKSNPKQLDSSSINQDLRNDFPKEVQQYVETRGKVHGKLSVTILDNFKRKKAGQEISLYDKGSTKTLDTDASLTSLYDKSGKFVQVQALEFNNEVVAYAGSSVVLDTTVTQPSNFVPGPRKTALIMLSFRSGKTLDITKDKAMGDVFSSKTPDFSTAYYYKEVSNGKTTIVGKNNPVGDVYGPYTIDYDNTGCNYPAWGDDADKKARAAGVDLTGYDNYIYLFPYAAGCNFEGIAMVNGNKAWMNHTTFDGTVAHELGHNFGLLHANQRTCKDNNGQPVLLSNNCVDEEYGSGVDVMGWGGPIHFTAFNMSRLNYLSNNNTQTITQDGQYKVGALGKDPQGIQSLRIPYTSNSFIYVEYRADEGFVNGVFMTDRSGVFLHVAGGYNRVVPLYTLKPSPQSYSQELTTGPTVYDITNNISIKVVSSDSNSATVEIKFDNPPSTTGGATADTTAPSVPQNLRLDATTDKSVTLKWDQSTDNSAQSLVYALYRNGVKIAEVTSPSYTDDISSLAQGANLSYYVKAIDLSGNSSVPSNTVTYTVSGGSTSTPGGGGSGIADTTPPSSPSNLHTISVSNAQINLGWNASTDNQSIARYDIYRNDVKIGTSFGTSFGDATVQPSTSYTYYIRAVDTSGNMSTASGQITVRTPASQVTPTSTGNISGTLLIKYKNTYKSAAGYNIGLREFKGSNQIVQSSTSGVNGEFSFASVSPGTYELIVLGGDKNQKQRITVSADNTQYIKWVI